MPITIARARSMPSGWLGLDPHRAIDRFVVFNFREGIELAHCDARDFDESLLAQPKLPSVFVNDLN